MRYLATTLSGVGVGVRSEATIGIASLNGYAHVAGNERISLIADGTLFASTTDVSSRTVARRLAVRSEMTGPSESERSVAKRYRYRRDAVADSRSRKKIVSLLVRRIGQRTRTKLARYVPRRISVVARGAGWIVPVTLSKPRSALAPEESRCAVLARKPGVPLRQLMQTVNDRALRSFEGTSFTDVRTYR